MCWQITLKSWKPTNSAVATHRLANNELPQCEMVIWCTKAEQVELGPSRVLIMKGHWRLFLAKHPFSLPMYPQCRPILHGEFAFGVWAWLAKQGAKSGKLWSLRERESLGGLVQGSGLGCWVVASEEGRWREGVWDGMYVFKMGANDFWYLEEVGVCHDLKIK